MSAYVNIATYPIDRGWWRLLRAFVGGLSRNRTKTTPSAKSAWGNEQLRVTREPANEGTLQKALTNVKPRESDLVVFTVREVFPIPVWSLTPAGSLMVEDDYSERWLVKERESLGK